MTCLFGGGWLAELSESAAEIEADPGLRLVLEQTVSDNEATRLAEGPADPDERWTVALADGRVTVSHEDAAGPKVRLRCDRATAEGIHHGTISASAAFLDGRLRISGDWQRLMAFREHLAAVARQLHP